VLHTGLSLDVSVDSGGGRPSDRLLHYR
jgi:hypothetical protein